MYIFKKDIEPSNLTGVININKLGSDINKGYISDSFSCGKISYTIPNDSRLVSSIRGGLKLNLDSIPAEVLYDEKTLYTDKNLDKYGQNYKNYSDISSGQITYYIDKSIASPYFKPVFSESSKITGYIYKDPMGAEKPIYDRQPLNNSSYCLSSIKDTNSHRENLMASQSSKLNQGLWMPRYVN